MQRSLTILFAMRMACSSSHRDADAPSPVAAVVVAETMRDDPAITAANNAVDAAWEALSVASSKSPECEEWEGVRGNYQKGYDILALKVENASNTYLSAVEEERGTFAERNALKDLAQKTRADLDAYAETRTKADVLAKEQACAAARERRRNAFDKWQAEREKRDSLLPKFRTPVPP